MNKLCRNTDPETSQEASKTTETYISSWAVVNYAKENASTFETAKTQREIGKAVRELKLVEPLANKEENFRKRASDCKKVGIFLEGKTRICTSSKTENRAGTLYLNQNLTDKDIDQRIRLVNAIYHEQQKRKKECSDHELLSLLEDFLKSKKISNTARASISRAKSEIYLNQY